MVKRILALFRREEGQSLSEYCLLTALVALVVAAVFIYTSGGVQNLWTVANSSLTTAGTSATGNGGGAGSQPAR